MSQSDELKLEADHCPTCKNGMVYDHRGQRFVTCTLCKGKGWIFVEPLCACGAPVTTLAQKEQHLYCGRKECLADLRVDALMEDTRRSSWSDYGTEWPDQRWAD